MSDVHVHASAAHASDNSIDDLRRRAINCEYLGAAVALRAVVQLQLYYFCAETTDDDAFDTHVHTAVGVLVRELTQQGEGTADRIKPPHVLG